MNFGAITVENGDLMKIGSLSVRSEIPMLTTVLIVFNDQAKIT